MTEERKVSLFNMWQFGNEALVLQDYILRTTAIIPYRAVSLLDYCLAIQNFNTEPTYVITCHILHLKATEWIYKISILSICVLRTLECIFLCEWLCGSL
jgi:hypothetical protein